MPEEIESKQPEDIFAEIEKKISPAKTEAVQVTPTKEPRKKRSKIWLKILIVVLIGLGCWFGFPYLKSSFIKVTEWSKIKKEKTPAGEKAIGTEVNKEVSLLTGGNEITKTIVDQDNDGLSDEEEQSFGTDPLSTDTDQDGLTDKEEVKIYQTDPLNPDTDGDGLKDGEEVRQGLNPKNPSPNAKLMDLQSEINKLK